ncbi:MAG: spore cortex biosynthesis protein YabQ [Caldibacillus debilis]|uniref:spore cortex biosynthesis protein YabQ n=1 Tax=Caldibacillus debilis TaxID=301148 RepID=UPI00037120A0|nr:spore cortex biosynthesis protein YabQ [Caldibacillus debilis]REJ19133.1 MAG: spore cortex biosynthesis protein YabQ [Caldibacillus debilis]
MSLSEQLQTMAAMVALGNWLGASFDTYSRIMGQKKRMAFLVFVNDILFWLIQAFLAFSILYAINEGEVRFYVFLAILLGFSMYQSLFKSLYLFLLNRIIALGKRMFRFFGRVFRLLVAAPVRWIFRLAAAVLFFLYALVRRLLILVGKLLFAVAKVLFFPFQKLFRKLWLSVPGSIKIRTEKTLHYTAGFFKKIWNLFH